jgi:hypothetical protein
MLSILREGAVLAVTHVLLNHYDRWEVVIMNFLSAGDEQYNGGIGENWLESAPEPPCPGFRRSTWSRNLALCLRIISSAEKK